MARSCGASAPSWISAGSVTQFGSSGLALGLLLPQIPRSFHRVLIAGGGQATFGIAQEIDRPAQRLCLQLDASIAIGVDGAEGGLGDGAAYRDKAVIEQKKTLCPIKRFRAFLLENALATEADIARLDAQAEQSIQEALDFANQSPEPAIENVAEDVYA